MIVAADAPSWISAIAAAVGAVVAVAALIRERWSGSRTKSKRGLLYAALALVALAGIILVLSLAEDAIVGPDGEPTPVKVGAHIAQC